MYCDIPDFGRCCICLPLRRGILLFGYINIVVSILLVAVYSYTVHNGYDVMTVYHGAVSPMLDELSIFLYLMDTIANGVLVYGVHIKRLLFIKIFYYYSFMTIMTSIVIGLFTVFGDRVHLHFELITLLFAGLCIQLYLIALVRSLIRKLEISPNGANSYENQLQQVVAGEIYEPTVIPNVAA